MELRPTLQKLIDFNCRVLDQALQVIAAHEAHPDAAFAAHSGPHLRHVIEHYEAFADHVATRSVDYDSRERDRAVERHCAVARERVIRLQAQLRELPATTLEDPIAVHLRGGVAGEDNFVSFSTVARELLFISSHAVHHYALIHMHCQQQGIDLGSDFGKAPSTVHHERQR